MSKHASDLCQGTYCCLHNPSDHHMKDWPLKFRSDKKVMTRVCPHGIDHPDPDDLAFGNRLHPGSSHFRRLHGCDNCCKVKAEGTGN